MSDAKGFVAKDVLGREVHDGDIVVVLCAEGFKGQDAKLRVGVVSKDKIILNNDTSINRASPKTKMLRYASYVKAYDKPVLNTSAGVISTTFYDDECARGVEISLNDELISCVDVLEPHKVGAEGSARVIVYHKGPEPEFDKPIACIPIN